jgi:hypothetical protein
MATVFARRANFKRWLSRNTITPQMKSFREVFSKMLGSIGWLDGKLDDGGNEDSLFEVESELHSGPREGSIAHYSHEGKIYSRGSAHTGNSLIAYEKHEKIYYGSIETITKLKSKEVVFQVTAYKEQLNEHSDAFSRYAPHFPAQLLSSKLHEPEEISISAVKCHCARYMVSKDSVLMIRLLRVSKYYTMSLSCF